MWQAAGQLRLLCLSYKEPDIKAPDYCQLNRNHRLHERIQIPF